MLGFAKGLQGDMKGAESELEEARHLAPNSFDVPHTQIGQIALEKEKPAPRLRTIISSNHEKSIVEIVRVPAWVARIELNRLTGGTGGGGGQNLDLAADLPSKLQRPLLPSRR
jgi:hypothetical protein